MSALLNGTNGYLKWMKGGGVMPVTAYPYSISMFVQTTYPGVTQYAANMMQSDADRYAGAQMGASGSGMTGIMRVTGNTGDVTGGTNVTANIPRLCIVTFDSPTRRTIAFGTSTFNVSAVYNVNDGTSLMDSVVIGAYESNGAPAQLFWKGELSEVHIFNRVLDATDWTAINTGTLPETLSGHVDGWPLRNASDLASISGTRTLVAFGGVTNGTTHPLTRATPPTITTQPTNQTVLASATATFSSVWSGSPTGYQWERSTDGGTTWNAIGAATAVSYTTPATTITGGSANNGDRYRVKATNGGGTSTSNAATLTVNPLLPSIQTQPASTTVTATNTVTLTVAATASGGSLTYQWQRSTDSGSTWANVAAGSGGTTNAYTTAATSVTGGTANNGDRFRVQVTDSNGTLASNAATLTVNAAATAVTMTGPSSGSVNGQSSNFSIGVSGGALPANLVVTPSDAGVGGTFNPTSLTLTPGSPTGTFTYTPSTAGARTISVTNNGGLSNPLGIAYTATAQPIINTQPTALTVTAPNTANFTIAATASGGALSFQWQRSTDAGVTWSNTTTGTGSTTNSYVTAATSVTGGNANNGDRFRCVLTDSNGTTNSNGVILTVNPTPTGPTINTQPSNAIVSNGSTAVFTVVATANGGSLTYQWQRSTDGGSTWSNVSTGTGGATSSYTTASSTITGGNANNGDRYRVQVTDSFGTLASSAVTLTVNATGPSITTQPQPQSATTPATVTFTAAATASSGSVTWQWQRSTDGGSTWANVAAGSGGTTNAYTTPATSVTGGNANNGDRYRARATDSNGTTNSNGALLTVGAQVAGTATLPQFINDTSSKIESTSGWAVYVRTTTMGFVADLANQSTNANGDLPVSSTSMIAGTSYVFILYHATHGWGLQFATAA